MGITAASLIARISIDGAESAEAKLLGVGKAADSGNLALSRMALGATVVAGAAFIGLGAVITKMAGDFQATTETLVTGAGEQQSALDMVRQGILRTAVDTATGTQPLINAMFTIESAGYRGAQGLTVLKDVAEEAKVGQADLGDTAQVTTVALHNYHLAVSQAVPVLNSFNATVKQGDMHLTDLNAALINVLPAAQAARVKLTDVEGALATMSVSGDRGAAAGTHLSQMFLSLEKPSSAATSVLKEVGLTTQQISDDMQKSLPDTIQLIYDALAKKFPPGSAAFNAAAATIVGGTRQMKAWNELTGQSFADLTQKTGIISAAYRQGGQDVSGWAAVQDEFNTKLGRSGEVMETLGIKAGTQLLPIFGKLLDAVTPLVQSFSDWIDKNNVITNAFNSTVSGVQSVTNWYNQWHTAIGSTVTILSAFLVPAIIASGAQSLIAAGKIAFNFVAAIVASGAEAWGAVFKIATYVGVLIATGAQAIVSATAVTTKFVVALIATAIQAGITASTMYGGIIPALYATGASAVSTAAGLLVKLVPALGATGVASSVALGPLGLLAAGLIGLGFALKYAIDSAEKMNKQVSFNVDDMSTKNIQTVDRMRLHLNASVDQMVHGVKVDTSQMAADAAKNAQQMQQNVTVAAQTMASNTLDAMGNIKNKGGQSFADLLSQVSMDMSQIDATAKQYWADVMGYIENNPIQGRITYTAGGVGVQQSPTTGHNAEGTDNWRGGWSWVGEKGPELMNIPQGAQIIPHDRSMGMGGPIHVHVTVNPELKLDGYRVTKQLMPHMAHILHDSMGTRY